MSRPLDVSSDADILNSVWDTEYCNSREAFSIFREGICSTFMPWSPEFKSERPFVGRLEGMAIENGSIGRTRISPFICVRTKSDIAGSMVDGFYANYVISGELMVEQAGRTNIAKQGDLVIYDTSSPVTLTLRADSYYEDIPILVPKSRLAQIKDAEDQLNNVLVPREGLFEPLAACLSYVQRNVTTLTVCEWTGLLDAFASLLPLATGCCEKSRLMQRTTIRSANSTLKRMLEVLDRNLSRSVLSPQWLADEFGVSRRYVHQLFAVSGNTFSGYVRGRRLDKVREDLLSPTCRNQPIHAIAYRWGFGDLSGFNRVFKKRFGCSPGDFRNRFGC